jgi:ribosome biogenesis ATPase
MSIVEPILNP